MNYLEIVMPGILLAMTYLFKIFVDRSVSLSDAIFALLELPVDAAFLATFLIVGFSISNPDKSHEGILWFASFLVGAFIIVILWRRSAKYFESGKPWIAVGISSANYILCSYGIVKAIQVVTKEAY